jgi:acyl-homoserine-lactone acylase
VVLADDARADGEAGGAAAREGRRERGVQVATRGNTRISIHGCGNCFQNINSSNGDPSYNAPYGEVVQGSSMVLTTHLTKRGPKSQGILTYSQATDPTSPWFANMTKLFSRKKWVKLAFTHRQQKRTRGKMVRLPGARR